MRRKFTILLIFGVMFPVAVCVADTISLIDGGSFEANTTGYNYHYQYFDVPEGATLDSIMWASLFSLNQNVVSVNVYRMTGAGAYDFEFVEAGSATPAQGSSWTAVTIADIGSVSLGYGFFF